MQGWRISECLSVAAGHWKSNKSSCVSAMEDAHAVVLNLNEDSDESNAFFAVYDGHGGMF
jgi:serine/threonine protein phosphatase PrpC